MIQWQIITTIMIFSILLAVGYLKNCLRFTQNLEIIFHLNFNPIFNTKLLLIRKAFINTNYVKLNCAFNGVKVIFYFFNP